MQIQHHRTENHQVTVVASAQNPNREPTQVGDPWQKATCLWLKGLPRLEPVITVKPDRVGYWVDGGGTRRALRARGELYPMFGDSGPASRAGREKTRSKTFPGIAAAMADQWGCEVMEIANAA